MGGDEGEGMERGEKEGRTYREGLGGGVVMTLLWFVW